MRVGGYRVPQDDAPLGAELLQQAMDNRPRRFFPWPRTAARPSVGITPAQQVELAGEGDTGPAHALVAGGLADRDHIRVFAFLKVVPQVGEPNRRRTGHIVGTCVTEL